MSLSVSLSSALSGLSAASRAAELVSSNVANALTEGYGRRELQLTARSLGGTGQGVLVSGVERITDRVLMSDRRVADANAAGADLIADAQSRIEAAIGTPEDATSLGQRIAALDTALLAAASRPESEPRLDQVLTAATALAGHFSAVTETIQAERARADDRIAADVTALNDTLARVAGLNGQILTQVAAGRDAAALMDQRQQMVDRIAAILPIRETERDNGQIALVTTGGAVLLDGRPAVFGFAPAGIVTADMTLASGALSGLTLNGHPVSARPGGPVAGGTLAAAFALRDDLAPEAQSRLDAVARDLVGRFAAPGVDPTLASGAPGLFTDAGMAVDPLTEAGLAGRISVNAAADPAAGGALWRLRDGMGATAPGPPSASALLTNLRAALTAPRTPLSGGFEPGPRSLAALMSDVLSGVSSRRIGAEAEASFATAKSDALRVDELSLGVDSDREVQNLLLIERAYAANARVVKSVDEMIQLLLGM